MIRYPKEGLYIAGPECFYTNGYELWWSQRKLAEYYGIPVVLPTSTNLRCNNPDLRKNAEEIFDDLVVQVKKTTAIIADLEFFRGSEPDGGTIFEMGWIWANGGRVYGYSRDLRPMCVKNQMAHLKDGVVLDQHDKELPYQELPFSPNIMGSAKLLEGGFDDILKVYVMDLDQERKGFPRSSRSIPIVPYKSNRIYISTPRRYYSDYDEYKSVVSRVYEKNGLEAVFSGDKIESFNKLQGDDPYSIAQYEFESNMALLSSCSAIVADLNDFHGLEPCNDVSFECGVAFGRGMKCIAYMDDTRIMRERIPHYGEDKGNLDWCGNVVENFNLPINLMFGTYFDIIKGTPIDCIDLIKQ